MLDPKDPFFESAIRNLIDEQTGRLGVLVRQLQGGTLLTDGGPWKVTFGFQTFSGFSLAQYATRSATINHNIGTVPSTYFPFIAPQDAGLSVQTATFTQGSMGANTMGVTLSNPFNFALTNAQLGWLIIYA